MPKKNTQQNSFTDSFVAHRNKKTSEEQLLTTHLSEVGAITKKLATKIGLGEAGEVIGLLHDFGKFSASFQNYLNSATGEINPDEDHYVDFKKMKGHIDHSSAGAQYIWEQISKLDLGKPGEMVGQILSLCIASHHSGLIDCVNIEGENVFFKRVNKSDDKTHKNECVANAPGEYLNNLNRCINKGFIANFIGQIKIYIIANSETSETIKHFNIGFLTRMLFSCLIDADRISSADFELPDNANFRNREPEWNIAIQRLESAIKSFSVNKKEEFKKINKIRAKISDTCLKRASDKQGIYTLSVPTGGGKTYASLRYALNHAQHHRLDRIIYIIPFTSIIDQNAQAIREVLDFEDTLSWVLEQHSNLEPEQQTWHSKLASENWDAPVVMTTMVQFLEVLFSSGTRGARKMHQLANSVLIFDEIQTLPINCTHLFCNALNFLTNFCQTTSVLCTATQPLLNKLENPENGQLSIPKENELMDDVGSLFSDLKRVQVVNKIKDGGWTKDEIADFSFAKFDKNGSCLIITNTKQWALDLYLKLQIKIDKASIFYLSTNLCPAHRKNTFDAIKTRLKDDLPVMCISTQLIEAGVDVDFATVVRFLAGLDSIAQAAGRCNRNGSRKLGETYIVNPDAENIGLLKDIKIGIEKTERVLSEGFDDLLTPEAMSRYFQYYFYDRRDEMVYPIQKNTDNLLNLLSNNPMNPNQSTGMKLTQSFMESGKQFKVIDAPTQAVIVPYGQEGKHLITQLCAINIEFEIKQYHFLLKQAQKFSVNVFSNVWKKLQEQNAIFEIQQGEGIYYLKEEHYSDEFGLSEERCNWMDSLNI